MQTNLVKKLTLELSMISGARYQRVATYSVRNPVWSWSGSATRAKPKSQIWRKGEREQKTVTLEDFLLWLANLNYAPRLGSLINHSLIWWLLNGALLWWRSLWDNMGKSCGMTQMMHLLYIKTRWSDNETTCILDSNNTAANVRTYVRGSFRE